MKLSISSSPLRTLSVALLCACAISTTASAALIAGWDGQNTPPPATDPTPTPWDWHDNVTVSDLTMHGGVTNVMSGTPLIYKDFSTSITTDKYVGFTVTPNAGFELTLTNLYYVKAEYGATSYSWGYRIGEGSWNMFTGEVLITGEASLETFVFSQPIVTTQTIEFGFFAAAPTANTNVFATLLGPGNDIQLNGSVTAVPEPSTYAMIIVGGLAAVVFARRRKLATSN